MNQRDEQILKIAVPAIVTNITVPLLGLVDTAIVGHMGDATYIGAIAVGSMVFNLVYWVFGFLRMGTSGLTAQARGRRDRQEMRSLLVRSLTVAMTIAALMLVFQWPLRELMLWLIGPTDDVRPLAVTYYNIVVWGAPAILNLYGLTGWFIGMQNTRLPMVISISQNVVNIVASLTLVDGLGMKVEGVAWGTVVAQYAGLLMAVTMVRRYYFRREGVRREGVRREGGNATLSKRETSMFSFLRVNSDIFLRTLCLVAVNLYFTSAGARQGATILAVNALLMQLYLLFSYFLDGFAYAGEALGGRFWGAGNMQAFREVVGRLFVWGAAMTVVFTTLYVVGGMPFLRLLTDEETVVLAAREYVWWAWLIPVAGVAAFVWDGIFIGITQTRGMLLSAALASAVFLAGVTWLMPLMGNHGLWLSMVLYLAVRGAVQSGIFWKNVKM
jgi:MATE family multidrug resistance protein